MSEQELLTPDLQARLEKIESMLAVLVYERQPTKEWYTTNEVAHIFGVSRWSVSEWCRLGRCNARKKRSGRGSHASWVVSHEEIRRIQSEGLLPPNNRVRHD
jgi:hypothetical protein